MTQYSLQQRCALHCMNSTEKPMALLKQIKTFQDKSDTKENIIVRRDARSHIYFLLDSFLKAAFTYIAGEQGSQSVIEAVRDAKNELQSVCLVKTDAAEEWASQWITSLECLQQVGLYMARKAGCHGTNKPDREPMPKVYDKLSASLIFTMENQEGHSDCSTEDLVMMAVGLRSENEERTALQESVTLPS